MALTTPEVSLPLAREIETQHDGQLGRFRHDRIFLERPACRRGRNGNFRQRRNGRSEALTAISTEITSLVFNKITSSAVSKAVKISLTAKAKGSRTEKTENFYNTVILRGSY